MGNCNLKNIKLKKIRRFLVECGCTQSKVNKGRGGHEKWVKKGLSRPIMLSSHIDPVPEFIIQQIYKSLGLTRDEFCHMFYGTPLNKELVTVEEEE